MKKIRFNIITVMLFLSVLALILIQIFQIIQLYDRKEIQFYTKVNDCLNRISFRHEKAEDMKRYLQIVNRDFSGEYREILKDEFKDLISAQETISIRDTSFYQGGKKEQYLILQGDVFDSLSGISAQQKVLIRDIREFKDLISSKGDTSRMAIELNQKVTQQIFKKAKFINEMMIEAFRDNIHVSADEKIDLFFLDSIITSEFRNDGLPNNFKFTILNKEKKQIEFYTMSPHLDTNFTITNQTSKIKLFPNNFLDDDIFLYVEFFDKNLFLFQEMKNTFLATGTLVVFIVIALIFMFKTIMQQKKLSELKSDFISNMTHEFKTPISTISLACQAAEDKDMIQNKTENAQFDSLINMIKTENKRLELLVESILQSAVIDKGDFQGNKQNNDLKDILKSLVENTQFRIQKKNGRLEMNINNLSSDSYLIFADKIHLTNLVANILDNAVKYSKESALIKVDLRRNEKKIILTISDQGIGIAKENLHKIFERLYRVPTGNIHNVKGFGLGLSYVKSICDHYGWEIRVNSTLGEGSTFEIHF